MFWRDSCDIRKPSEVVTADWRVRLCQNVDWYDTFLPSWKKTCCEKVPTGTVTSSNYRANTLNIWLLLCNNMEVDPK